MLFRPSQPQSFRRERVPIKKTQLQHLICLPPGAPLTSVQFATLSDFPWLGWAVKSGYYGSKTHCFAERYGIAPSGFQSGRGGYSQVLAAPAHLSEPFSFIANGAKPAEDRPVFHRKRNSFVIDPAHSGSKHIGNGFMKKFKTSSVVCGLAAVSAATLFSTAVFAQDLEQRMNVLEQKFDAILELMQQQMDAKSGPSAAVAAPAASAAPAAQSATPAPERLRMGQLYLDVYALSETQYDVDRAYYGDVSAIPPQASGVPVGSITVEPQTTFAYGAFLSEPSLSSYAEANALIQTVWSGVIRIEKGGNHAFQLSLGKEKGDKGAKACRSTFSLENKEIVSAKLSNGNTSSRVYSTEQGSINLDPGFYDFDIYLTCARYGAEVFKNYNAQLLMAGPGDRSAKPIPANLFGIKE